MTRDLGTELENQLQEAPQGLAGEVVLRVPWTEIADSQVRAVLRLPVAFRGIYGTRRWGPPPVDREYLFVELWQLGSTWLVSDRFIEGTPNGVRHTRENWREVPIKEILNTYGEKEVRRTIIAKQIEEAVLGHPQGDYGGPPVFVQIKSVTE
ncbi:MAG: hypothetical protein V2B18_10650 [Pseudomonadota bacterium]